MHSEHRSARSFPWTRPESGVGPRRPSSSVLAQLRTLTRFVWTEEAIDQVRELLVANPVEVVAKKIGRTPSSVKHLCSRVGIRSRELRCDLFSVTGLAAAIHVRKTEIVVWIEQGWLEAVREHDGNRSSYKISPEALQRCLREHLPELQKRNIRSANILAVFQQYCYVPKHTVGEQLLQVREAKREQAAYDSATITDR